MDSSFLRRISLTYHESYPNWTKTTASSLKVDRPDRITLGLRTVSRVQSTGVRLIWCFTTLFPPSIPLQLLSVLLRTANVLRLEHRAFWVTGDSAIGVALRDLNTISANNPTGPDRS